MRFWQLCCGAFCCLVLLLVSYEELPAGAAAENNNSIFYDEKQWIGDFDQLKEKRAIRILVTVSNPDFFIDGFRKYGFAPPLIKEFQDYLNNEVLNQTFMRAIIIPTSRSTIIDRLASGYGDVAMANLTITPERQKKVDFALPIATGVKEIIVAASGSPVLKNLEDLSGKSVHTRSFSSYHEHLVRLNKKFERQGVAPVNIVLVNDEIEDDYLLSIAAEGLISYMVLDHRKMELWQDVYDNVVPYPNLAIDFDGEIAWVVRKNNPKLLKIVSDFCQIKQDRFIDYEKLRKSTLEEFVHFSNLEESNVDKLKKLYPYFKKAGDEFSLPPLFLSAIAFEQSAFSAKKVGRYGELGVMQLAPFIEREFLDRPDQSENTTFMHIRAAAKYLAFLRDEKFGDLAKDPSQQLFFVLAAYFNGPEKINQMRWITGEMGKNKDKWFNEVNVTVSRLIGRETVRAVRNVALYWLSYKMATESDIIVLSETSVL